MKISIDDVKDILNKVNMGGGSNFTPLEIELENFVFSEQTLDLLHDRIKNNLKECFIKYRVTLEENKIEELTDTLTNEFFYMKFICPAVNLKEVFSQSLSRMTFDQLKKEINPAIKNLKIEIILK